MAVSIGVDTISEAAGRLYEAEQTRTAIPPLVETYPGLSPDDAYRIQRSLIDRKLREGAHVVGHKIGLTAVAMQQLLGVDQPDFGHLLDTMMVADGDAVQRDTLIFPRVEAEIAFCLREDLQGPGVTAPRVLAATDFVFPALDVVDSRGAGRKVALADRLAHNAQT